jgi:drug/metabolite transporter (DMT)-like permease
VLAPTPAAPRSTSLGAGLALLLVSTATFGTSGAFAASLLDAGWSAGAAVTARVALAAVVLTVPAMLSVRGRGHLLVRNAGPMVGYGLIAVAGCQLAYFNAVERLDVAVALLLEYLGTVLVVGWLWLRHGQRPSRLTVAGALTAVAGLVLVLDVLGAVRVDLVGVLWALAAAAGLATFFVLSAQSDADLPPLAMAWGGLTVGALALGLAGVVGALPMAAPRVDVRFMAHDVSWLYPVLGLALVAAVIAYVAGIEGTRRLGARLSSFVGLTEVIFAVLFAWLALGQAPTVLQLVGGAVIVTGVALVRLGEPAA